SLGLLPLPRTGQQYHRVTAFDQTLGKLSVPFIAPVLGPAVQPTGVQSEERAVEADAESAEAFASFLASVHRQADAGNLIDHPRRVHGRQQRGVVVELMAAFASA